MRMNLILSAAAALSLTACCSRTPGMAGRPAPHPPGPGMAASREPVPPRSVQAPPRPAEGEFRAQPPAFAEQRQGPDSRSPREMSRAPGFNPQGPDSRFQSPMGDLREPRRSQPPPFAGPPNQQQFAQREPGLMNRRPDFQAQPMPPRGLDGPAPEHFARRPDFGPEPFPRPLSPRDFQSQPPRPERFRGEMPNDFPPRQFGPPPMARQPRPPRFNQEQPAPPQRQSRERMENRGEGRPQQNFERGQSERVRPPGEQGGRRDQRDQRPEEGQRPRRGEPQSNETDRAPRRPDPRQMQNDRGQGGEQRERVNPRRSEPGNPDQPDNRPNPARRPAPENN